MSNEKIPQMQNEENIEKKKSIHFLDSKCFKFGTVVGFIYFCLMLLILNFEFKEILKSGAGGIALILLFGILWLLIIISLILTINGSILFLKFKNQPKSKIQKEIRIKEIICIFFFGIYLLTSILTFLPAVFFIIIVITSEFSKIFSLG